MTNKQTKKQNYVEEADILEQWRIWEKSNPDPKKRTVPDKLAEQILLVAHQLLNHRNFVRYPYDMKDEMAQEGYIKCHKNLKNYDPAKGKLFSYFTRCCWSANMDYLNKYYRQLNVRRQLILDTLDGLESDPNIQESNQVKELRKRLREFDSECTNDDPQE